MKFVYFFIIIIFIIGNVSALGITPGRTTFSFTPNLEKSVTFEVLNPEGSPMEVVFSVEGELKNYVSVSNNLGIFKEGELQKSFEYKLNLPRDLSPGFHSAEVVVLKSLNKFSEEITKIEATVSVVTQIYIYVPYPGKYIESSFEIFSEEKSNTVEFHIPFISRGDEEISDIHANLEVFGGDKKIIELETNSLSAKTNERKELFVSWNPELDSGEYWAVATINYDGKIITHEGTFRIGVEDLDLIGIDVKAFELGDVAKMRILVENQLDEPFNDVFATIKIVDEHLENVAELKSVNYAIPGKSKEELVVYWDTEDVTKGIYRLGLGINYNGTVINKDLEMEVEEDKISFMGVGFVVSDLDKGIDVVTVLVGLVIFLVLINLFWIVFALRGKRIRVKRS